MSAKSNKVAPSLQISDQVVIMGEEVVQANGDVAKVDEENAWLKFENLSYQVTNSVSKRLVSRIQGHKSIGSKKVIFSGLNGGMLTTQLVAIMGPSGAGKSTLLECLANIRTKGRSGRVFAETALKRIKTAFIPQHDNYHEVLTVKECVMYASRLQNSTKKKHDSEDYMNSVVVSKANRGRRMTISHRDFHEMVADDIIKMLGLAGCSDVPVGSISGGQKKRLSIAQELVSKPTFLFLDEPTSGLDSSACWSLMRVLHDLTFQKPPIMILLTIHQPSPKVLSLFHKIFMLSSFGSIIYEGFPDNITHLLEKTGLNVPSFYNPGDMLIELAAGEHGREKIDVFLKNLGEFAGQAYGPNSAIFRGKKQIDLKKISKPPKFPKSIHFSILLKRSFILLLRDPMLTSLRFLMHFSVAIFVGYLYGSRIGRVSGCPPDIAVHQKFDPARITSLQRDITNEIKDVMDNLSNLFFNVLIIFFGSLMPTLLTFPMEMSIFVKETTNSWHGIGMYYLTKTLADVPFQLLFPTIYSCITYFANAQPVDPIRFILYLIIMIMTGFLGQSFGLIFGALFMDQPVSAVFIAPLAVLPTFLFSGFLIKIENMPQTLQFLSNFSPIRYAMEGVIISIYGFGRCSSDPRQIALMKQLLISWMTGVFSSAVPETSDYDYDWGLDSATNYTSNVTNVTIGSTASDILNFDDVKSLSRTVVDSLLSGVGGQSATDSHGHSVSGVMTIFNLNDEHIMYCFLALLANFVVLRITTYILIIWRAKAKK